MVSATVRDSGPGIASEILERAVLRYEGGGDKHRPDHVGLGLPVSKMLAEHMGGQLRLTGDSVVVTFPAAPVRVEA